ncbi:MAG TPA: acyl-CoA dehydrogenase family protein, partial [Trebonia sp.]|nr:acyl-CoA dehydrogenase family protein [Trebonia sp.]
MDPDVDADFYSLEQLLDDDDLRLLRAVREFMEKSVAPVINHYWIREEFPAGLLPGLAGLGIAGLACKGYECPGGSSLLDGMIALELARVDCSIATFTG